MFGQGGRNGLVGGDHVHQPVADAVPVVVGLIHQSRELHEEPIVIEGNGAADVDQLVLRLPEALLRHELLLVQLLSGAKAGIGDLNVYTGLESGQFDQVPGQGIDLHGSTHIQHEDLAALGVGPRQHHQAHRLRNGHEVPDHVRMSHGHWAALGDLLLENRDNGTVAAQYVPETDCHEFGPDILKHATAAVLVGVLKTHMREKLGDLVRFPRLDLGVEALNDHFAQPLGGAHHVGGVHGLVRRDQHEPLTAVDHGRIGGLVGADHVVLNRLAGAVLHERHVFMGCRMVNDLRMIGIEHLEDPAAVPDGADEGDQLQIRIVGLEFQLDIVSVVLIDIENDELLGVMGCDLPAKLAADGSAAAGDQYPLAVNEMEDLPHVRLNGFPAQQVLHGHVLHGRHGDLGRHQLIHTGQLLEFAIRVAADIQNIPLVHSGCAGDSQKDLVHMELLHVDQDVVPAAHYGNALQVSAPFVGIVVDDADHLVFGARHQTHVSQDQLSRVTCADEHDPAQGFSLPRTLPHLEPQEPVGEANAGQHEKLQDSAGEVVQNGHPMDQDDDPRRMEHAGQHTHRQQPDEFRQAGVAPQAPVQPERRQHQDRENRIRNDEN